LKAQPHIIRLVRRLEWTHISIAPAGMGMGIGGAKRKYMKSPLTKKGHEGEDQRGYEGKCTRQTLYRLLAVDFEHKRSYLSHDIFYFRISRAASRHRVICLNVTYTVYSRCVPCSSLLFCDPSHHVSAFSLEDCLLPISVLKIFSS
jgi:hypothetical protein